MRAKEAERICSVGILPSTQVQMICSKLFPGLSPIQTMQSVHCAAPRLDPHNTVFVGALALSEELISGDEVGA